MIKIRCMKQFLIKKENTYSQKLILQSDSKIMGLYEANLQNWSLAYMQSFE